jgi:hypothetical protein
MSGINRQLFLNCLGVYILFKFHGTPSFKVDKTHFQHVKTRHTVHACRINVALAAHSVYQNTDLIYTSKLIFCHNYISVLSAPPSVAQNLQCLL